MGLEVSFEGVQCLVECVQAELEEQVNMVKVAEDHAKKASADASRLAEELRQEQDHSTQIEKARRTAETIAKDLQTRLDEAEAAAMQGGRKIVQKMEQVCEIFDILKSVFSTQPHMSVMYQNISDWLTVDYLVACKVLLTVWHICFHQKSTTLANVLEVTAIHSLYAQINYVNPLLSLDAYFVFFDY